MQRNSAVLREALNEKGLPTRPGITPVIPLVIGDAETAVAATEHALGHGVFAQAIRPPTVPVGTSRLRLTVMASHTKSELREAASTIAAAVPAKACKAMARHVLEAQPAANSTRVFDRLADAA